MCKREGLKVSVNKSKLMMVGEESSLFEIMLDRKLLEQVTEFNYLGYRMDEKGTDG